MLLTFAILLFISPTLTARWTEHNENMLRAKQSNMIVNYILFLDAWEATMEWRCAKLCNQDNVETLKAKAERLWNSYGFYNIDLSRQAIWDQLEQKITNNNIQFPNLVSSNKNYYAAWAKALSIEQQFNTDNQDIDYHFKANTALRAIAKPAIPSTSSSPRFSELQQAIANAERWEFCALGGGHYNDIKGKSQTNPTRAWKHAKDQWVTATAAALKIGNAAEHSRCIRRTERAKSKHENLQSLQSLTPSLPSWSTTTSPSSSPLSSLSSQTPPPPSRQQSRRHSN